MRNEYLAIYGTLAAAGVGLHLFLRARRERAAQAAHDAEAWRFRRFRRSSRATCPASSSPGNWAAWG